MCFIYSSGFWLLDVFDCLVSFFNFGNFISSIKNTNIKIVITKRIIPATPIKGFIDSTNKFPKTPIFKINDCNINIFIKTSNIAKILSNTLVFNSFSNAYKIKAK